MTLNPFVYGNATTPKCFDESSPCMLEQLSMCVINVTQKADSQSKFPGQDKYVPWLVCMDTSGDKISECHQKAGVDPSAVSQCMSSDQPELLKKYLKLDVIIKGTPTVYINGKIMKQTSYRAIYMAICEADPSLKGCQSNDAMPDWADWEPPKSLRPTTQGDVVV